MGINSFQAPPSPIDAITKALGVANTIYGIKHASAASDLINAQLAETKQKTEQEGTTFNTAQGDLAKLNDPASNESKLAKTEGGVLLNYLQNSTASKKNPEAVNQLSALLNDPGTTGKQVKDFSSSPILKDIVTSNNKDAALQYLASTTADRNTRGLERTELSASKDYRKEMLPYEGTIQAANRASAIVDQIKSGALKSTPTLRNDLNAAVGSMFNNGKGATVYGMSHSDQASLEGRINAGLGYVTGTAQDTIPAAQLDQLQKDIGALKGEYSKAHTVAFDSFKAGLPDRLQPKMQARYDQFRKSTGLDQSQENAAGSGLPGMSGAQAADLDPQITNFAKMHGLDYGAASHILQQRGYNGK